jgi:hypothetical protein
VDDASGWRVGGEGAANAIAELLRSQGRQVDSPEFEGDHGWTFVVRTQKGKYYFQVQHSGDVTLFTDDVTVPSLFGRPRPDDHIALLTRLNEAMSHDERFSSIRWCAQDEWVDDDTGTATPTG